MLRCKLLVVALFSLLACGCATKREGQAIARPDEAFTLAVGDSILFKDSDTRFWLSLQGVQDNRCPKGVNCITGGKATAQLAVEAQADVLQFCVGSDCSGKQNNSFLVEYNNERYTIVLEEVTPYPQTGNEMTPKQTILKIKRATS